MPNIEKALPMYGCHAMRVASLTKTITATAIMLLAEDGLLKITDKMAKHLSPDVIKDIPGSTVVTIEQLLNHTSGIPNYDDDPRFPALILNNPGSHISIEDKLGLVRGDDGIPRWVIEKFDYIYANTNYLLLQLVLENVAGIDFKTFVTDSIFNPLAIENVEFGSAGHFPQHLATGYVDFYGNNTIRNVHEWDAGRFDGEGNLIMTAEDVFLFFSNLLEGNIVSLSTLEKMKDNRLGFLPESFDQNEAFGHDGIGIGYSAEMWHLPASDVSIVLLANQGRLIEDTDNVMVFENLLGDLLSEILP